MHVLKVFLDGIGETLVLRFKLKGNAEAARATLLKNRAGEGDTDLADDYGMQCFISNFAVRGVWLIDARTSLQGDVRFQIMQQQIGQDEVQRAQMAPGIIQASPNGMPRM